MNGVAICSGIGGLELGVELAVPGYRTVCHVEREAFAVSALVAAMESDALDPAPIWSDVATFDGCAWRGVVDIVTAGFPCQPWSHAGKQEGTDDERWIWPDIARTIRDVEPGIVFLENVPGLVSGGGIEPVLGDLSILGFDGEWDVFSAAEVGAPHLRERVFILANAHGSERRAWHGNASADAGTPGQALADGESGRRGKRRQSSGGRGQSDGGGTQLADAEHNAGTAELEQQPSQRANITGRGSETVADAGGEGLTGTEFPTLQREGRRNEGRAATELRRAPLFPPGPDGDWERWLNAYPGTEPSVRRDADGLADRTDQFRALGNGVVPLQAAYAFVVLAERLGLTS